LWLPAAPRQLLDARVVAELATALEEHAHSPKLKLIMLAATGSDFCLGSDLTSAQGVRCFHALLYRLIDLGIPTAAVVRGRCLGAGLELAAFCNFIFADSSASFGQSELGRGSFPSPASLILPLKLGPDRSGDLVLTGAQLDAQEAYRRGLVTAWARSQKELETLVRVWLATHLLPKS